MNIQVEKSREMVMKGLLWKHKFETRIHLDLLDKDEICESEKLSVFVPDIAKVTCQGAGIFKATQYIQPSSIAFYEISQTGMNIPFKVIEILDIRVNPRYRSKGIGSQLLNWIEDIGIENDYDYIVGELQVDRTDEPLEARKKFFERHGYKIWKDERSKKFSGWVVKKKLN